MKTIILANVTLLMITGCATDPTHVEEDFGLSVKQMVEAQLFDPEAAANPPTDAPIILDGMAGTAAVEGYRTDAKRQEAIKGIIQDNY